MPKLKVNRLPLRRELLAPQTVEEEETPMDSPSGQLATTEAQGAATSQGSPDPSAGATSRSGTPAPRSDATARREHEEDIVPPESPNSSDADTVPLESPDSTTQSARTTLENGTTDPHDPLAEENEAPRNLFASMSPIAPFVSQTRREQEER
jgi:hypothetical protein